MFNFTIIIPHKNTPNLLQRCLDSIPIRDDLQIVIIDDDSEPSIVDFQNFPGKNRSNVDIFFTKEGKGAGYARNIGLKEAKGKWILFADADDYFTDNLASLFDEYKNNKSDIIFFNAKTDSKYVNRTEQLNEIIAKAESNYSEACFLLKFAFGEPWCKIVKRELIENNNILFAETPIHNDTKYSYLVGFFAKSVAIDKRVVYIVSVQEKSTSRQKSKSITYIRVHVFAEKDCFLRKHNIQYFDHHFLIPFWECINQLDFHLFLECLKIAKQYSIKKSYIIKYLLCTTFFRICKKTLKLIFRLFSS